MKRTIIYLGTRASRALHVLGVPTILILALTSTAFGQMRNARTEVPVPAPTSTGTVTLSLTEFNRLTELAARKPKANDAAPLPFVLSTAAFKLRVEDSALTGTVEIAGN